MDTPYSTDDCTELIAVATEAGIMTNLSARRFLMDENANRLDYVTNGAGQSVRHGLDAWRLATRQHEAG